MNDVVTSDSTRDNASTKPKVINPERCGGNDARPNQRRYVYLRDHPKPRLRVPLCILHSVDEPSRVSWIGKSTSEDLVSLKNQPARNQR
jgi:hypothetical protein